MTLTSGQAFRWREQDASWVGIVQRNWVRLQANESGILAETAEPFEDWTWLEHYLQVDLDLPAVLGTFPADEPMRMARSACGGLRLLRQDPWECLASFILSSTKQILQIQQIVSLLCQRYGEELSVPAGQGPAWTFPTAERLASVSEEGLRACKMGFRAPFLLSAARRLSEGKLDLPALAGLPVEAARAELMALPGVGPKICNCVLLFAYGRQEAFPVDVWVMKALRQLYFPRRKRTLRQLQQFAATYFGPNAGYAQQYLFHYARLQMKRSQNPTG
jgi:N-glycosylase/DNA lyase